MSNKTVEVPIAWLKQLIELGKRADVGIFLSGIGQTRVDKTKLIHLKGFIESAETLISNEEEK